MSESASGAAGDQVQGTDECKDCKCVENKKVVPLTGRQGALEEALDAIKDVDISGHSFGQVALETNEFVDLLGKIILSCIWCFRVRNRD
jgi:hypothetical protein